MNLPNSLTLLRIFIVPLLVVVLLTPFSENWFGVPRHILGVALFLGAALTDYLDGHLARSRGQVTRLGQLLDPIADKLLISAALISLVENQLAPAWAVVIIIGREFAVTGLRSIAATDGVVISASKMGKFKMLVQVLTVALLIVSSVAGKPPVGNFGRPFPAIAFWSVPELRAACAASVWFRGCYCQRLASLAVHGRQGDALVGRSFVLSFDVWLLQSVLSIGRFKCAKRNRLAKHRMASRLIPVIRRFSSIGGL